MFVLAIDCASVPGGSAIHGNGDFTTTSLIQSIGVQVGNGFFGKGQLFDDTFFHNKSPLIVILIFNALKFNYMLDSQIIQVIFLFFFTYIYAF
jgi:hypothetical protein